MKNILIILVLFIPSLLFTDSEKKIRDDIIEYTKIDLEEFKSYNLDKQIEVYINKFWYPIVYHNNVNYLQEIESKWENVLVFKKVINIINNIQLNNIDIETLEFTRNYHMYVCLLEILFYIDFKNINKDELWNLKNILKELGKEVLIITNSMNHLTTKINYLIDKKIDNTYDKKITYTEYRKILRERYEKTGIYVSNNYFNFVR